MKAISLLMIYAVIFYNSLFSQCANPGLKIESQDCAVPKDLYVSSLNCSAMDVRWSGNKNQTYLLKAVCVDPSTKTVTDARISSIHCDQNGNCSATIFVREGSTTSWSVQAVCVVDNAQFYSSEINGADRIIPVCPKAPDVTTVSDSLAAAEIHVYPNPSAGILHIDYAYKTEGIIKFTIYDAAGKEVYNKPESVNSSGNYTLLLVNLVNGVYLLEVKSSRHVDVIKFDLFRK